jgi:hypothetical protein
MTEVFTVLQTFATSMTSTFRLPGRANPEDQLKPPMSVLFGALHNLAGAPVKSHTEAQVDGLGGRPDMAIFAGGLLAGHVELKAPGRGADPTRFRDVQSKTQWEKFKALPNLVYTDGESWALYRHGERVGLPVRATANPSADGAAAFTTSDADALSKLLSDFLRWTPIVPHTSRALAAYLAPLARLLRDEAHEAARDPRSALTILRTQWSRAFFPDADEGQFADSYAQAVVYALLLARLSGAANLEPDEAADALDRGNGLLAQVLRILADREARRELRLGFDLVRRSLEALDPDDFLIRNPDPWLYFYEDFLAAYDPDLRRDAGVYYTPVEVVELQVRLIAELLETRFGKRLGFADDGVISLDPSTGTGTYLLAAIRSGLVRVRDIEGAGAVGPRASLASRQMKGFEILVGPYAVAHTRLTAEIIGAGGKIDEGRLGIYLADALENPFRTTSALALSERRLADEHEAARRIKTEGTVLVVFGNPPYDRQTIEQGDGETKRKGGWIRFGDKEEQSPAVAKPSRVRKSTKTAAVKATSYVLTKQRVPLDDFIEPAKAAGQGVHLKNLYNDYVYFWRFALWRVSEQQQGGGIVSFITASSYLAGPAFVGMREEMRRVFDEIWVLDLGGDSIGTRKTPNVFAIRTPVAIAFGLRSPSTKPEIPALVHYARVDAVSRETKLSALNDIRLFAGVDWQNCPSGWQASFLPEGQGDYFAWPLLTDLFPWQHSGAQFKRTWPIGITDEVLTCRWSTLLNATRDERADLFRLTGDRSTRSVGPTGLPGAGQPSLDELPTGADHPRPMPYLYRPFDRRRALFDGRLGDRLRPDLFSTFSDQQVVLCGLLTKILGRGPAVFAAAIMPDMDVFCGRGAKDIIPMYKDAETRSPNLTSGLLSLLEAAYGTGVTVDDLTAYAVAILGSSAYSARYWNELGTPGLRVPLTRDGKLFANVIALGRQMIHTQTFGARFGPAGVLPGLARCTVAVPNDEAHYPDIFTYYPDVAELAVGTGRFAPIAPEIMAYEVSGLKVVESWLGYRMREPRGRTSSALDAIHQTTWTPQMTNEMLEVLWTLERLVAMEPDLATLLGRVAVSPCFSADELPAPKNADRKAPRTAKRATRSKQIDLL